ncbi:hypothetical protein IPC72_25025 [Pseudomonas aeruginosa]|uniref:hypothetical protein n=1 Tax=Pseudomonas aeruginosa TaxID=287 RepID=UPI00106834FB|nr:hypothetical protein [Pseudomonas aeruginosa]TEP56506.1 hypothetical protein IPC72_25025 [Pseudomonas aeruginosa]
MHDEHARLKDEFRQLQIQMHEAVAKAAQYNEQAAESLEQYAMALERSMAIVQLMKRGVHDV